MRISKKFLLFLMVAVVSGYLFHCSYTEYKISEFDENAHHITGPIGKVARSPEGAEISLNYINRHYPDATVCFFPQYSSMIIKADDLSSKLEQIPGPRTVGENKAGVAVLSRGKQYNFIVSPFSNHITVINRKWTFPCIKGSQGYVKKGAGAPIAGER